MAARRKTHYSMPTELGKSDRLQTSRELHMGAVLPARDDLTAKTSLPPVFARASGLCGLARARDGDCLVYGTVP